ncbi:peptidase M20 [Desulfovibrio sp. X2]|uniref:M20 family metallo-hydrolase n=1 Tax=Desulfovibrio sp. X2 TaxID=941449 RepID=UPI0003588478|nr:M20 family metallo-hydrolase [Desulfovibrio sp. X2]EPR42348.1 peptidase M20 [Desulfovibrio sp. X2]
MIETVLDFLDTRRDRVVELQRGLVAIPALGPENGGDGEGAKCDYIRERLAELGIPVQREMNAPDPRVPSGVRPSLAARVPGKSERTLWVISHVDVVPPGELSLWSTDPWTLSVDGDVLVGRGVEDNNQAIVSSLLVAEALVARKVTPELSLGMIFVADEETGSKHGLDYVLHEHGDLFRKDDLFLVPDFGEPDGSLVELAEKSMLWLKITVLGKQCHASRPSQGNNSLVAASAFVMKIRSLYERFDMRDQLFDPPFSTFEPTKKEANVENINTVPGKDVFYVDCRVLADYRIEDVEAAIRAMGDEIESIYGVKIEYESVQQEQAAPATPLTAEITRRLLAAIEATSGLKAQPRGIGGGTVAAFLRRRGFEAAVWATLMHNAHQPGEKALIVNHIGDAKVIARMLLA